MHLASAAFLIIFQPAAAAFLPSFNGDPVSGSLPRPTIHQCHDHYVDCAIVGGGPAGLAASIAISKSDPSAKIAIYESDNFQPKGASIQISPPGWLSLKSLDAELAQRLKKNSIPVTAIFIKNWSKNIQKKRGLQRVSQIIKKIALSVLLKVVRFCFMTARRAITYVNIWHDVRVIMAERAKELHRANDADRGGKDLLYLNCTLEKIIPLPTVQNNITGEGSSSRFEMIFLQNGQPLKVYAKHVLACDGTMSTVRSVLPNEPDVLLSENKSVWRGRAPNVDTNGEATFFRDTENGRSGLIFPAGKNAGSSWAVISDMVDGRSGSDKDARERLYCVIQDCDDMISQVVEDSPIIIENKLYVRDFDLPWEAAYDGLAFLGDAAHPVRPTGEGTALALEDAKVLSDVVGEHSLCVKALRKLEMVRYEPVKKISENIRNMAQKFYQDSSSTSEQYALYKDRTGL